MTEAEWWFCVDPSKMLPLIGREQRGRKLRHYATACCFRIEHLITDIRSQRAVQVAECYADGTATEQERAEAEVAASSCYEEQGKGYFEPSIDLGGTRRRWPNISFPARMAMFLARSSTNAARCSVGENRTLSATPLNVSAALAEEAILATHAMNPFILSYDPDDEWVDSSECDRFLEVYNTAKDAEAVSQCRLLRDIFGNPFQPVIADPSWLTSTVVQLSQGIYSNRAFDRMPILADALQDAGCDDADILDHCRDANGVHVRGCWVVDLLLGKS